MMDLYVFIDAYAGWGLLLAVVLALALRAQARARGWRRPPWPTGASRAWGLPGAPGMPGTVALAVLAAVALVVFGVLAREVTAAQPAAWLTALDGWATQRRMALPGWAMAGIVAVTRLGDVPVVTGVTLLAGLVMAWRGRWRALAWWWLAVAGNGLLVRWTKQVFGRSRPDAPYLEARGYGFPSGHAMATLVAYGLLCFLLWHWGRSQGEAEERGRAARGLAVAGAVLIVGVGLSRVALGVHYASDVLAGWMLSLAWLALLGLLARPARRR